MTPIEWAIRPLQRYVQFSGRAPRAEYWWWVVAVTILNFVTSFIDQALTGPIYGDLGPLGLIQAVALIVPGSAVIIRRLHDTNHSGWWFVLNLWSFGFLLGGSVRSTITTIFERVPTGVGFALILGFLASVLVLLVFMVTRGTEGVNRYGPDPYGEHDELEEVFA